MSIEFPNPSRSYDETRHRVRFSGYDGTREILMFIEEAAIRHLDSGIGHKEGAILQAFDRHRKRICEAAVTAYGRRRGSTCTLNTADVS